MTRLLFFGFTIIFINTSCGQNTSEKHFAKKERLQKARPNVDTSKIAIFNPESNWWLRKKINAAKSFSLPDTDLKTVDEVFRKCVRENHIDTSYFHYRRQYVPFIDKDGQRKVWMNCFCSDVNDDFAYWQKSIVLVDDGGSCFFNVVINLADQSFSNFEVNSVG